MNLSNVFTIAGREFRAYFDQAIAYILIVVFLVANYFFFFRTAFATGEASLRPMFDLLPWLLLLLVPALTMRSIAEDRSLGTIELVLSQPVRESDYLLGKFFGTLAVLVVALFGTGGAWFAIEAGGDPFLGPALAQYAGTLLLCAAFVAIGLWASATTRNQITAFILAVAVIFVLIALTLPVVLIGLPPSLAAVGRRLGVLTHYHNITRGVLDLRDVVYFVSVTATFLALAYLVVQGTRRNIRSRAYRTLQASVAGLVAIAVLANLLGQHIGGRLDLTPGGAYTLSDPTRAVLHELDDVVTIRFFASDDLPIQAESVRRDVEDLLADFSREGGDEVRLLRRRPEGDNEAAEEAERLGIPSVEFNTMGEGELQVRVGYLGLVLEYADASEVIPFVQQASDLEYRLTSAVLSMVRPTQTVVGLASGLGGPPQDPDEGAGALGMLAFARQLSEAYTVTTVDLSTDTVSIPDSVRVLVLAGPEEPLGVSASRELRSFLARGGNLFLMYQQIGVSQQQQLTEPAAHPHLDSLLMPYGVRVAEGMLVDVRSNQPLQVTGSGGAPVQRPFPPFPITVPTSNHPIVAGLGGVSLATPSPLDLSGADTTTVTPLLATTEFGGLMPSASPLEPTLDWRRLIDANQLRPRPAAAAVLPRSADGTADTTGGGRIVLVGDADLVTNRFIARSRENLVFARNAVDWLAADESLIGIRAKRRAPPSLLYDSTTARSTAKYGALAGVPLLFVLIGVWRLLRRRRLAHRVWTPPEEDE